MRIEHYVRRTGDELLLVVLDVDSSVLRSNECFEGPVVPGVSDEFHGHFSSECFGFLKFE